MEQEIVKPNAPNNLDMMESIYVKKTIFVKKIVIIIINLYKIKMKMLNAINYVNYLLNIKENAIVKVIILVI